MKRHRRCIAALLVLIIVVAFSNAMALSEELGIATPQNVPNLQILPPNVFLGDFPIYEMNIKTENYTSKSRGEERPAVKYTITLKRVRPPSFHPNSQYQSPNGIARFIDVMIWPEVEFTVTGDPKYDFGGGCRPSQDFITLSYNQHYFPGGYTKYGPQVDCDNISAANSMAETMGKKFSSNFYFIYSTSTVDKMFSHIKTQEEEDFASLDRGIKILSDKIDHIMHRLEKLEKVEGPR